MKLTDKERQVIKERLQIAANSMIAVFSDLGPPKKGSINVKLTQEALSGCEDAIAKTDDSEQAASHLRNLATNLEGLIGNTHTVALELRETALWLESALPRPKPGSAGT